MIRGSPPRFSTDEPVALEGPLFYRGFRTSRSDGGEGGIRTPDRLAPMPHFECGAFNHSATSPEGAMVGAGPLWLGALIGEDGGPDKARKGKIRCLFRRPQSRFRSDESERGSRFLF